MNNKKKTIILNELLKHLFFMFVEQIVLGLESSIESGDCPQNVNSHEILYKRTVEV